MLAYQAQNVKRKFRESILKELKRYDQDFNTPWEREVDELLVEWKEHHRYRIVKSAQDIDFDNEEANMGKKYFRQKAFYRLFKAIKWG